MFFTSGAGVVSRTWADVGTARGRSSTLIANTPACTQIAKLARFISKILLPRIDLSTNATHRAFARGVAKDDLLRCILQALDRARGIMF
jgi:hypothetical protein